MLLNLIQRQYIACIASIVAVLFGQPCFAEETPFPKYKPSSRSPEAIDIRTNAYGASRSAPQALEIGDRAPDFVLPRAGEGEVSLARTRADGPVVIVFYRGHW